MPYKKFFEGSGEGQSLTELSRFLSSPDIRVLWRHAETLMFKQKDKGIYGKTIFYVFYQDIKEELQHEQESFKSKLETAKEVSTDERYYKLKNVRQRELFLLNEHFLSKTEAQDVIELLKPELAQIIRDSKENEEEDIKDIMLVGKPKKTSKEEIDGEMKEFEKELNEGKKE